MYYAFKPAGIIGAMARPMTGSVCFDHGWSISYTRIPPYAALAENGEKARWPLNARSLKELLTARSPRPSAPAGSVVSRILLSARENRNFIPAAAETPLQQAWQRQWQDLPRR